MLLRIVLELEIVFVWSLSFASVELTMVLFFYSSSTLFVCGRYCIKMFLPVGSNASVPLK